MLLIVEIAMLVGGIYALTTAKVPGVLVGGGNDKFEGTPARLMGILLMLPLPVAIVGSVLLIILFGEDGKAYGLIFEAAVVVGAAVLAIVFVRVAGKRIEPVNAVEATVKKKAEGAFWYAILGFLGFVGLILGPLALFHANQAIRLIDEHHVGEQYRNKARSARNIGIVTTLVWWAIVIIFALSLVIKGL